MASKQAIKVNPERQRRRFTRDLQYRLPIGRINFVRLSSAACRFDRPSAEPGRLCNINNQKAK